MSLLPRAIKRFTSRYGSLRTLAYIKPQRMGAFWLGSDSELTSAMVTETHILQSREYQSVNLNAASLDISESDAWLYFSDVVRIAQIKRNLEGQMGKALRRAGYVVEPGVEPEFAFNIILQVRARVLSWPAEPGVTTPPYRPLHDVRINLATTQADAYQKLFVPLMDVYDRERLAHFSVVALAEPETLAFAKRRTLDQYVRLIEDENVPRGVLRIAEEIA